jgi:hypothetical protein
VDAATTSRFSTLLRGHHDDLVKRWDDLVKRWTATVTSGLRGRLSETELRQQGFTSTDTAVSVFALKDALADALDLSQPAASWSASPAWATSAPGWPGRPAAGP